jgi:hypothetical protein
MLKNPKKNIKCDPPDLKGEDDPRKIENIMNSVYLTCDD